MFNLFKKNQPVIPTMEQVRYEVSTWVQQTDHELIRKVLVTLTGNRCSPTKEFDTEQHLIDFWTLRVYRYLNINRQDGQSFFNRVEKYLNIET